MLSVFYYHQDFILEQIETFWWLSKRNHVNFNTWFLCYHMVGLRPINKVSCVLSHFNVHKLMAFLLIQSSENVMCFKLAFGNQNGKEVVFRYTWAYSLCWFILSVRITMLKHIYEVWTESGHQNCGYNSDCFISSKSLLYCLMLLFNYCKSVMCILYKKPWLNLKHV